MSLKPEDLKAKKLEQSFNQKNNSFSIKRVLLVVFVIIIFIIVLYILWLDYDIWKNGF